MAQSCSPRLEVCLNFKLIEKLPHSQSFFNSFTTLFSSLTKKKSAGNSVGGFAGCGGGRAGGFHAPSPPLTNSLKAEWKEHEQAEAAECGRARLDGGAWKSLNRRASLFHPLSNLLLFVSQNRTLFTSAQLLALFWAPQKDGPDILPREQRVLSGGCHLKRPRMKRTPLGSLLLS